ncbi:hypothetical protein ANO14919_023360 [Xylariales sp. No.14919]|nr:hypothetical protein ANO14919_023360 [Xylariales sp. No.14919]
MHNNFNERKNSQQILAKVEHRSPYPRLAGHR